jgi:uncharacterized protein (DUF488 family)
MSGLLVGIGYEGRTQSELLEELRALGVTTVVDVRLNPISRKKGFSKGPLTLALDEAGVRYVHAPALGTPPAERAGFRSDDFERARNRARERMAATGKDALERLATLAATERVAVLCFERDEERCHRHVILEMVRALGSYTATGTL